RAPCELLDDHRGRSQVEPEAAIARVDERAEDAELGEPGHEIRGIGMRDVEVLSRRNDLLVHELANREDHLPDVRALALARGEGPEPLAVPLEQIAGDDGSLD